MTLYKQPTKNKGDDIMAYTSSQIKDSVQRVDKWIKNNKYTAPKTVRVNKDTLTFAEWKKISTIASAKTRINQYTTTHNREPNYVDILGVQVVTKVYKVIWTDLKKPVINNPTIQHNAEYDTFCQLFGTPKDFDDALKKIENHGYGHYYNNKYTNKQTLTNIKNRKNSPNCTDSCQAMHKVASAMGYTVQGVHVQCSSGEGHIFLRLKHPKNTGNEWIYRDPASVLSTGNNNGIKGMWCKNGKVLAYNPQWYMQDLNK